MVEPSMDIEKTLELIAAELGALVRAGMKMVISIQRPQKETEHKLNALIDSQIRTDGAMRKSEEKFNRLLEKLSFKRSNGHN